ncbi:MAG: peptide chain release factor-like protein [Candidatus Brocadiaceae bacterium]|nr:peptide chain release factor-like protein [Candidatus Brocadiaceae bacterium]
MSIFNVSSKKEKDLLERMKQLNVSENDIEEKFIRSSGPGGQKVNKSSSGVSLHHLPTGAKVKCGKERSQPLNRFFARRMLLDQIERVQKGFTAEEKKRIEKIRRQKRKRSKNAKKKMAARQERSENRG